MSETLRLYGTTEPPAQWRTLRAGPLGVDLENGQLRYIRFEGVEVLRGISFLVRDEYWGTFGAELTDLRIEEDSDRFRITYSARCAPERGDLRYEVAIFGEAGGRLGFEVSGAPEHDLLTNRLGFVVLLPLDGVVGAELKVEHTDGTIEDTVLPKLISPHEPIKDIFALTHSPAQGLSARTEMTGDAYDMEDQRNWTDASLKVYIRPLSKPKPYTVPALERFEQAVRVTISGQTQKPAGSAAPVPLAIGEAITTVPRLALGLEAADAAEAMRHLATLRRANAVAIVGRPTAPADISALAGVAMGLGAELQLELAIPGHEPDAELAPWSEAAAGITVKAILVTPFRLYPLRPADALPGPASLAEIARAARRAFPHSRIGGGVMTGFTEFNRNRPPVDDLDFVSHVTTAIVHAADDRSVMETIDALPHVMRSGRAIAGRLPYRLGPSGIALGLNPDGPPRRADADGRRATMIRNDPRQRGQFGAAWTLAWLAAAAHNRIEQASPASLVGDFGIINSDGSKRPLFDIISAVGSLAGRRVSRVEGLETGLAALAVEQQVWIANLGPEARTVNLSTGPLTLSPYAVEERRLA